MLRNTNSEHLKFLDSWEKAARDVGIPQEAYQPRVRVIKDDSGNSGYSFGIILNPYRTSRPSDPTKNVLDCPLCQGLVEAESRPVRRLDKQFPLEGYAVIPNKFPTIKGHTMAVTNGIKEGEVPMYSTKSLEGVAEELEKMSSYASRLGLQAFHNSEGAGASIPNHEHWHLTNWEETLVRAGEFYGFEAADIEPVSRASRIGTMPGFPFAHLVFDQTSSDRIVSFLSRLSRKIGRDYDNGAVPHAICQGSLGVLVVPYKKYVGKGSIGSGDVAGHIPVKEREQFETVTYEFCLAKLITQLFSKDEIDLEKFL